LAQAKIQKHRTPSLRPRANLDGLIQRLARLIAPSCCDQASAEIQWRATADEDGHYSLAIPL